VQDPLDPLNGQDPLDDPMLDAVERSIEDPAGFRDPSAELDQPHMDELGRLLGQVEHSIETTPPSLTGTRGLDGPDVVGLGADEHMDGDAAPARNGGGSEEEQEDKGSPRQDSLPVIPMGRLFHPTHRSPSTPAPSRQRGDAGSGARGLPPKRRTYFGGRRAGTKSGSTRRHCPDTRETVDLEQCESCNRYRHWPDGTDEEPRECWYDWEESRLLRQGEDDGNVGDAP
jgi:hypothetical protein